MDRAFLDEHERLARRSRELHSLHALGRGLDSVTEPDRVLALVGEAAATSPGSRGRRWWPRWTATSGPGGRRRPPRPSRSRCARAWRPSWARSAPARRSACRPPCPGRVLSIAIDHGGDAVRMGVPGRPAAAVRRHAGPARGPRRQAATTLHNLELLQERIRSDRLTTVGRMISTIVHDFRNPMTSIRGYAAMIEEMDIGPARRKECAHLVLEETERDERDDRRDPRVHQRRARRACGGSGSASEDLVAKLEAPGRPRPGRADE